MKVVDCAISIQTRLTDVLPLEPSEGDSSTADDSEPPIHAQDLPRLVCELFFELIVRSGGNEVMTSQLEHKIILRR
jgi:hypothetical protein